MEITKDIRNQISEQMSAVQTFLYSSPIAGNKQFNIAQEFQLDSRDKYKTFATTVGDVILGFYKVEDTVALLEQELELDADTAAKLGAEVIEFLAPLSDPTWQPPIESGEIDNKTEPVTSETFSNELTPTPNFDIASNHQASNITTETIATAVPDIHTMASDATLARSQNRSAYEPLEDPDDEIIHSSSQPDFRQSLADLPAYTSASPAQTPTESPQVVTPPRWGS